MVELYLFTCSCILIYLTLSSALLQAAVHRGFWRRAAAIPIESIFEVACRKGKRLVLCGCALPDCSRREGMHRTNLPASITKM